MLFLCFFLSKLIINKVELENSVCVTRHPGDDDAIDRPKYRLRPFWRYFRHFDFVHALTLDLGYGLLLDTTFEESSCYDWYRRSMFINDPVAGYSATVRDDDLLSVQCNTLHGTENKITLRRVSVSEWVSECVCVCAHGTLGPNISKRAGDRGLVTMGHE